MKTLKHKKLAIAIMAVFLAVLTFIALISNGGARTAHAVTTASTQGYDNSDVLDDLRGMTIDGKVFTLNDYPVNESGTVKVISLVEYCYSYYADMQANFGLYVYVYNPQQLLIDVTSGKNMLEMRAGGGTSTEFNKYSLKICTTSFQSGYENLFYKFKVDLTEAQKKAILMAINSESRIYEVSGIELLSKDLPEYPNAKEYPVGDYDANGNAQGKKFTYTGYGKGYGQNSSEGTLNCDVDDIEVAKLEVKHTVYRPHGTKYPNSGDTEYRAAYVRDSVASAYFAIPKDLCGGYDELTGLRAQWLPATTAPMVITGNQTVYDALLPYVGDYLRRYDSEVTVPYSFLAFWGGEDIANSLDYGAPSSAQISVYGNLSGGYDSFSTVKEGGKNGFSNRYYQYSLGGGKTRLAGRILYQLNYLFYAPGGLDGADRYAVSSDELYDWVRTEYEAVTGGRFSYYLSDNRFLNNNQIAGVADGAWSNEYQMTQLPLNLGNGYYSALFDSIADEYKVWDISRDDEYKLTSFEWTKKHVLWFDYAQQGNSVTKPVSAIQEVTEEDLKTGNKETICENLLISTNDYDNFISYFNEKKDNNRIYLVRFDKSDYVSAEADELGAGDTNAYICQEQVYLDFDIIHVKVEKDGVEHIIACVMSPIDIFPETMPPYFVTSDLPPWWQYALYIGLSLVGIFIGALIIKKLGVRRK